MKPSIATILAILGWNLCLGQGIAKDWPTWRHDAQRSSATSEELPAQLHLQWSRDYPPLQPAWPEDSRLHFDACYEPVLMGHTVFLSSSANDSVTAIDAVTGKEKWKFFAGGPVRFAPIASEGRVYFGADDSRMYCLDAERGEVIWQFHAAPGDRWVLGNERLVSLWPVRGGPVLDGQTIYFTAGIWPFEGTFLYALDCQTGRPVPPSEDQKAEAATAIEVVTLKDKTPQGYLAIGQSKLLIPCGRSNVACLDRETGQFVHFGYKTAGVSNYHVCTDGSWLFHGLLSFDMANQEKSSVQVWRPILTDEALYSGQGDKLIAYDLTRRTASVDRRGETVEKPVLKPLWDFTVPVDSELAPGTDEYAEWIANHPVRFHLKAGNRVYGHHQDTVFAVKLSDADREQPTIAWNHEIKGSVSSMIAGNGHLIVVTHEGRIYCFGQSQEKPKHFTVTKPAAVVPTGTGDEAVAQIVHESGVRDGYCVFLGVQNGDLLEALARQSQLRIIGVDSDESKVNEIRRRLNAAGLYGKRVALHVGDPLQFGFPPYLASLVLWQGADSSADQQLAASAGKVFEILRPYGGTALLRPAAGQVANLAGRLVTAGLPSANVKQYDNFVALKRSGPLPGAANWTHEFGDSSNSLMSTDQLVKSPLGVLWFGGPASATELFYDRHFWGPSYTVVDGRIFIQGPGKLTAVDQYTGRILWNIPLQHNESYNPGRRGNDYDQVLAGFHYVAVSDAVYLVLGDQCLRLDPVTGVEMNRFQIPGEAGQWGRMRVHENLLIGSIFRPTEKYGNLPVELVAMDRATGQLRWSRRADLSFPVVAIGGDRLFCFDGALENYYRDWIRKGLVPNAAKSRVLRALDVQTGTDVWQSNADMVVTWIGYSPSRDVLIASNKNSIKALAGRTGEPLWTKESEGFGFKGHPENLWDKVIIWNDRLIDQRGPGRAYQLETGEPITARHPITGEALNWEFTRHGHHCNYVIANPHLMTFRSGSAGFCDIATGQTARLRGFRTGCRNSLIPAGGILNSPNFAHGCSCGYSIFTSLALVHVPETEMWNYSAWKLPGGQVERLGVNLGAPGDRMGPNGVLWLDYPNVGGSSPEVSIDLAIDEPHWFQLHSAFIEGGAPRWVASSGVEGTGSLTVDLKGTSEELDPDRQYTVRLHFVEPTATQAGQRVFDVEIEKKHTLTAFDIFHEAGGRNLALVKQFDHVRAGHQLEVVLRSGVGRPLISGVEIISE